MGKRPAPPRVAAGPPHPPGRVVLARPRVVSPPPRRVAKPKQKARPTPTEATEPSPLGPQPPQIEPPAHLVPTAEEEEEESAGDSQAGDQGEVQPDSPRSSSGTQGEFEEQAPPQPTPSSTAVQLTPAQLQREFARLRTFTRSTALQSNRTTRNLRTSLEFNLDRFEIMFDQLRVEHQNLSRVVQAQNQQIADLSTRLAALEDRLDLGDLD